MSQGRVSFTLWGWARSIFRTVGSTCRPAKSSAIVPLNWPAFPRFRASLPRSGPLLRFLSNTGVWARRGWRWPKSPNSAEVFNVLSVCGWVSYRVVFAGCGFVPRVRSEAGSWWQIFLDAAIHSGAEVEFYVESLFAAGVFGGVFVQHYHNLGHVV